MLVTSNHLFATFALLLLFAFTEISQGEGERPRNVIDGMSDLNSYFSYPMLVACFPKKVARKKIKKKKNDRSDKEVSSSSCCCYVFQISPSLLKNKNSDTSVQVCIRALLFKFVLLFIIFCTIYIKKTARRAIFM